MHGEHLSSITVAASWQALSTRRRFQFDEAPDMVSGAVIILMTWDLIGSHYSMRACISA